MTQEMILAQAEEKVRLEVEMEIQRKIDSKELAGETIRRELLESEFCLFLLFFPPTSK
jgi:microfibrillar-associated protein 1